MDNFKGVDPHKHTRPGDTRKTIGNVDLTQRLAGDSEKFLKNAKDTAHAIVRLDWTDPDNVHCFLPDFTPCIAVDSSHFTCIDMLIVIRSLLCIALEKNREDRIKCLETFDDGDDKVSILMCIEKSRRRIEDAIKVLNTKGTFDA